MNQTLHLALCFELPSGNVPEWVQLLPAGEMQGHDGRRWVNSNPQQILQHKQNRNLHIPLDIEHATHIKGAIGEPAPAVGWFEELEIRNGEVWGKLTVNEDGHALLSKQNYRYISPGFKHDAAGNITSIASVGLTNQPNLGLVALNHQQQSQQSTQQHPQQSSQLENQPMPLALAIATALSLNSETATETDAVNAIKTLQSNHDLALNRAANPPLDKFVPHETHELALNRATMAEQKLQTIKDTETEALVDSAISAGKVAPANKEMYLATCRTEGGVEQFKQFVASASKIADSETKHKDANKTAENLDENELAMCRSLGLTQEEYLAAKPVA